MIAAYLPRLRASACPPTHSSTAFTHPTPPAPAAQVRHHVPSFHEIIDRVVGVRHRTGSVCSAGNGSIHRRGTAASLRPVDPAIPAAAAAPCQSAAPAGDPVPPPPPPYGWGGGAGERGLPWGVGAAPGLAGGWAAPPGSWDGWAGQEGPGGWGGAGAQTFASASLEISAMPDQGRRVFALGAADPGRPTGLA